MEHLIFQNDPYAMDWIRSDFSYAEVTGPAELAYQIMNEREGDLVRTQILVTNSGRKPYFTGDDSIEISFPLPDKYDDSSTCMTSRCHVHLFCGGEISWICALRMGGEAPHLGMVLTEGSLVSYSIRRNILAQSNDRGCFLLHPGKMELAPGETRRVCWTIFPHEGKEDFRKKLFLYCPHYVQVRAERYVLFPGEQNRLWIQTFDGAQNVSVNGDICSVIAHGDGRYCFEYTVQQPGEQTFQIEADGIRTWCSTLVKERPDKLAERRCLFIAEHQQYHGALAALEGAYLAYDNEEKHMVYRPENDYNGGRERMGMGLLMARFLRGKQSSAYLELEESLKEYTAFVLRELADADTGKIYNDIGRDDSFQRLYNLPWAADFFMELYFLYHDKSYLLLACRVIDSFYESGGEKFYPIDMPILRVDRALEREGLEKEQQHFRTLFIRHADQICERGTAYPSSEVNYEQSIVAPAADILLSVYLFSRQKKYLDAGKKQMAILELFNGFQPDYHLYETAIRHWDGYWFGKRRLFGDTFPHYWSALTGKVFSLYFQATGDAVYRKRAEDSYRGVLSLYHEDGQAFCAYLYPHRVNGKEAEFFDPYANDQDWGLFYQMGVYDPA